MFQAIISNTILTLTKLEYRYFRRGFWQWKLMVGLGLWQNIRRHNLFDRPGGKDIHRQVDNLVGIQLHLKLHIKPRGGGDSFLYMRCTLYQLTPLDTDKCGVHSLWDLEADSGCDSMAICVCWQISTHRTGSALQTKICIIQSYHSIENNTEKNLFWSFSYVNLYVIYYHVSMVPVYVICLHDSPVCNLLCPWCPCMPSTTVYIVPLYAIYCLNGAPVCNLLSPWCPCMQSTTLYPRCPCMQSTTLYPWCPCVQSTSLHGTPVYHLLCLHGAPVCNILSPWCPCMQSTTVSMVPQYAMSPWCPCMQSTVSMETLYAICLHGTPVCNLLSPWFPCMQSTTVPMVPLYAIYYCLHGSPVCNLLLSPCFLCMQSTVSMVPLYAIYYCLHGSSVCMQSITVCMVPMCFIYYCPSDLQMACRHLLTLY